MCAMLTCAITAGAPRARMQASDANFARLHCSPASDEYFMCNRLSMDFLLLGDGPFALIHFFKPNLKKAVSRG